MREVAKFCVVQPSYGSHPAPSVNLWVCRCVRLFVCVNPCFMLSVIWEEWTTWTKSPGPGSVLDAQAAPQAVWAELVFGLVAGLSQPWIQGKVFSFHFSLSPDPPVRYIQKKMEPNVYYNQQPPKSSRQLADGTPVMLPITGSATAAWREMRSFNLGHIFSQPMHFDVYFRKQQAKLAPRQR